MIHRLFFSFKSELPPTEDSERTLETRLSGASWCILFRQVLELLAECSILWAWASIGLSLKETDLKKHSFSPVEFLWL